MQVLVSSINFLSVGLYLILSCIPRTLHSAKGSQVQHKYCLKVWFQNVVLEISAWEKFQAIKSSWAEWDRWGFIRTHLRLPTPFWSPGNQPCPHGLSFGHNFTIALFRCCFVLLLCWGSFSLSSVLPQPTYPRFKSLSCFDANSHNITLFNNLSSGASKIQLDISKQNYIM